MAKTVIATDRMLNSDSLPWSSVGGFADGALDDTALSLLGWEDSTRRGILGNSDIGC